MLKTTATRMAAASTEAVVAANGATASTAVSVAATTATTATSATSTITTRQISSTVLNAVTSPTSMSTTSNILTAASVTAFAQTQTREYSSKPLDKQDDKQSVTPKKPKEANERTTISEKAGGATEGSKGDEVDKDFWQDSNATKGRNAEDIVKEHDALLGNKK